jgi:hypothetical protein
LIQKAAALIQAIESHDSLNPSRTVLFVKSGADAPALTNAACSFWHVRVGEILSAVTFRHGFGPACPAMIQA